MYASKVTLSDEFKKKAGKGLSPRRKGQLMLENLKIADSNGHLQQAKNREAVGLLAGCRTPHQAYQYTYTKIREGIVTETLRGFENGKAVYEYHINLAAKKENKPAVFRLPEESKPSVVKEECLAADSDKFDATIGYKDFVIKLEKVTSQVLIDIIKLIRG